MLVIGDIQLDEFFRFEAELRQIEKPGKLVDVLLCSGGGDEQVAYAFYDRLRYSPSKIRMTCLGQCMSAAILVYAAADIRIVGPNAQFMVHESSSKAKGSPAIMVSEAMHLLENEDVWCKVLATRTPDTTFAIWRNMHHETTYFNAEEAIDLGLAHKLTKEKK